MGNDHAPLYPLRPFAFMVMPFGKKPSQGDGGKLPGEIDFNALWDKAFFPLLEDLGYVPVRADQEIGSLIINQMIERLYFSDLVLADLTIGNGNVHYEVGVRHAAQERGCVLVAAEGSKQLFDVAQMRLQRYPMPMGEIDDAAAKAIRDELGPRIETMRAGSSPIFETLRGYPDRVEAAMATGVRDQVDSIARFQGDMRALRALPNDERMGAARGYVEKYGDVLHLPMVGVGLLTALVDGAQDEDWAYILAYIEGLGGDVRCEPFVREQRALALGKVERFSDSIAELNALIAVAGDSSERSGLLGGRYKDQMRAARRIREAKEAEATRAENAAVQKAAEAEAKMAARRIEGFRDKAIESYERGMMLDLNDFYPSSNLPRLYRARAEADDESKAQRALHVTMAACDRALRMQSSNEWIRQTMLAATFDLADAAKAEAIEPEIKREGIGIWKLETTINSLEESLAHVQDPVAKARLREVLDRLKMLLPPPTP